MISLSFHTSAEHGIHRRDMTRPHLIRLRDEISLTVGKYWVTLHWRKGEPNKWRSAVIEALVASCIYKAKHDHDPERALAELVQFEIECALDPVISKKADDLVQRGYASALADRASRAAPTDEQILALAKTLQAYDGAKELTLRGSGDLIAFARGVLAL